MGHFETQAKACGYERPLKEWIGCGEGEAQKSFKNLDKKERSW